VHKEEERGCVRGCGKRGEGHLEKKEKKGRKALAAVCARHFQDQRTKAEGRV